MKKSIQLSLFALILSWALSSCSKEDLKVQNSQTEELAQIESTYNEYNIKGKFEGSDDKPKIESCASQKLAEKIKSELELSISKQVSYAKSGGNLVGVFKAGSCGSYLELAFNMDCEDHNPATKKSGWVGLSEVTSYKNVILRFCVVPNQYFVSTNVDYAILMLTSSLPNGVSRIIRWFDNENSPNGNWATYDGVPFTGNFPGDPSSMCSSTEDTRLDFYYYPHTTYNSFPSIAIPYGVLGRFGSNQGYIYSDDEDDSNADFCWVDLWNGSAWNSGWEYTSVSNIMDVAGNTRLYLSQARY